MGSTGNVSLKKKKATELDSDNYGVRGAVAYKGTVPENSGLDKPASNNVTLKYGNDKNPVLFQFKLTADNKFMNILAYRDGRPEVKVKIRVDAANPSINQLLKSGTPAEKSAAVKMKDLMNKSTEVSENQLGQIAENLKKKKDMNRG